MVGEEFTTDVLLISLGSCDMVFGIQWWSTIGNVYWDFKKLIMEFSLGNRKRVLSGIPPKKLKVLEGSPTDKMIENAAQLCLL